MQAVTDLLKAFALAVPHEKALEIRDDVGFFQAVRAVLAKGNAEAPARMSPGRISCVMSTTAASGFMPRMTP